MEIVKYRFHHGKRNNLFFYRDSNGNEVDILYQQGQKVFPIEIKSGQTITPAYFRGLDKFRGLFPDKTGPACLVYGGEIEQQRRETQVIRVSSLGRCLEELPS